MDQKPKRIFYVLALIGIIYFGLASAPNAVGAQDRPMLAVFEPDEFAQYPHVIRMLRGGEIKETIRRFFAYQHYYYGFPFYAYSAAVIFPLKLVNGLSSTSQIMWTLRQFVSVLPMLASVMIFVYLFTRFRSWWASVGAFVFLLAIPALTRNSLWWHPDSLTIFFVALTFYFLDRDDLDYRRDFLWAAAACGLAAGTKLIGLFFFLTIPTYIAWGYFSQKIEMRRALTAAVQFVIIMFVVMVFSNPMLFTTQGRKDIFRIQTAQSEAMSFGWDVAYDIGPASWFSLIGENYASGVFILFAFLVVGWASWKGSNKLLYTLVLTWVVPFSLYILFFIAIKPFHFFIPMALPLFGALFGVFQDGTAAPASAWGDSKVSLQKRGLGILLVVMIGVQFFSYAEDDIVFYQHELEREQTSSSLAFFASVEEQVLTKLPDDTPLAFYRDIRVYVPDRPQWDVQFKWNLIDYQDIEAINPDVILLSRQRAMDYTLPEVIAQADESSKLFYASQLYANALDHIFLGYEFVYADDFGLVFVRQELYEKYLGGE